MKRIAQNATRISEDVLRILNSNDHVGKKSVESRPVPDDDDSSTIRGRDDPAIQKNQSNVVETGSARRRVWTKSKNSCDAGGASVAFSYRLSKGHGLSRLVAKTDGRWDTVRGRPRRPLDCEIRGVLVQEGRAAGVRGREQDAHRLLRGHPVTVLAGGVPRA